MDWNESFAESGKGFWRAIMRTFSEGKKQAPLPDVTKDHALPYKAGRHAMRDHYNSTTGTRAYHTTS
jgi:hypothetical protein